LYRQALSLFSSGLSRSSKMRGSSAMKLLSASWGGFLMSMLVVPGHAFKAFYDYRSDADRQNPLGCGESEVT